MAACAFCEIIAGRTPAPIVLADEHCIGFLDHRPLFPGHVLLTPRSHIDTLMDAPPALLGPLFQNVQIVGRALEEALEAQGSFMAINNRISQSVPHLHVHIVPRNKGDGLRGFFWPRQRYRDAIHEDEIRQAVAAAIARHRQS
ncbi:MAG: HIT family protein [Acidobacteria bacterium]|nr:HIT family protein [Acidobacteriota bacterium]